jgi:type IV pilus assembly protein PilA
VKLNTDATGSIKCTMKGGNNVGGKYIQWNRNADGAWACVSDTDTKYLPKGCTAPAAAGGGAGGGAGAGGTTGG